MQEQGKILIVDDEIEVRRSLEALTKLRGYNTLSAENGKKALDIVKKDSPSLVILDLHLPDIHGLQVLRYIREIDDTIQVIIITGYKKVTDVIEAMKIGAYDHVSKPYNTEELMIRIAKALEEARLKKEVNQLKTIQQFRRPVIVGTSEGITAIVKMVEKIAKSDATTVLIEGESGTGKELVAKLIHVQSRRCEHPFIPVNCAAIPETLLETELMGYEKGAYTDAKKDKKGLLELANEGTLFLDEIGDMGMSMQAKLLRIIEDKTFRRVGGTKDIKADVRIIAATNANLRKKVEEGKFRTDLYYRLLVVPIYLPPLRERKKDILPLVDYFVDYYNKEFKKNIKGISAEVKKLLEAYSWPGNVRELKNVIERALILDESGEIQADVFPHDITSNKTTQIRGTNNSNFTLPQDGVNLEDVEKSLVQQALKQTNGNQTSAAKLLGLHRDALRRRMKKFNLMQ